MKFLRVSNRVQEVKCNVEKRTTSQKVALKSPWIDSYVRKRLQLEKFVRSDANVSFTSAVWTWTSTAARRQQATRHELCHRGTTRMFTHNTLVQHTELRVSVSVCLSACVCVPRDSQPQRRTSTFFLNSPEFFFAQTSPKSTMNGKFETHLVLLGFTVFVSYASSSSSSSYSSWCVPHVVASSLLLPLLQLLVSERQADTKGGEDFRAPSWSCSSGGEDSCSELNWRWTCSLSKETPFVSLQPRTLERDRHHRTQVRVWFEKEEDREL